MSFNLPPPFIRSFLFVFVFMHHWHTSLSLCLFMCVTDNMEVFLTQAERQYIVKYELDGLRAQRDLRIPGLSDSDALQYRDNICECSHPLSGCKHTGCTDIH